jgi:hypothetical protein
MTASEFAERFDLDTMPRTDWTFLSAHDRWILAS